MILHIFSQDWTIIAQLELIHKFAGQISHGILDINFHPNIPTSNASASLEKLSRDGISTNFLRLIMTDTVPSQLRKHMMHSAVMSSFWGVFASQTASWLVSGAETSTTRSFFVLFIDWYKFHYDPFSNE